MVKRSIVIFLLLALVIGTFAACQSDITGDEAAAIAMKDMNVSDTDVESLHIHEGTYQNQSCYNVYITAGGVSMTYVITRSGGNILAKMEGAGHSH